MLVLSFKIVLKRGILILAVFLLCDADSWIISTYVFFFNVTASAWIFSDPKHEDDCINVRCVSCNVLLFLCLCRTACWTWRW